MQLNTIINDDLMQQAKRLTGLQSEREIIEAALRTWIALQNKQKQVKNPAKALFESNFIGCGEADPLLSVNYKQAFGQLLNEKYRDC